ncbi:MAG TPA: hypothetical protein VFQ73_09240 [Flavisolibacter sp.]|jgi:hypothetical protein|nr:hypothetical protein [Flavisolibacter sp.]
MKKRLSRVLNFFAFNLLFFALYLNFIHKDSNTQTVLPTKTSSATVQGTTLVSNPDQYLNKNKVNSNGTSYQKSIYN